MIFKLQVVADDGHPETCQITSVERRDLKPETLGLTLAEGKAILKGIQQIVIQRQAATCLARLISSAPIVAVRAPAKATMTFRSEPSSVV